MIHWDDCKEDFRGDGSLRDIYVTPATLADWRALYSLLRDYPGVEYAVDGVIQSLPAAVEEVFALRPLAPLLRVQVGPVDVVFHFFQTEIECDFVPNEVKSQADLDALLVFVQQIGAATGKRVVITPENCPQWPFISVDPQSLQFEHHAMAD